VGRIIESTEQSATRLKANVCHRSSAIFFCENGPQIKTTLIFLNHFLLKRDIPQVQCRITIRDLGGAAVAQDSFEVDEPRVYSVDTSDFTPGSFRGSAEIEFTSTSNLAIPFCAVLATYESRDGFCQLHAYSRTYNDEEMTEDRVMQQAAEIGWTLRDDGRQQSFAALHNGPQEAVGDLRILMTNHAGAQKEIVLHDRRWPAYGTMMVVPSEHSNVAEFLEGRPGHGAVFFPASRAFPRMCCGNRKMAGSAVVDLQATHSNFNYSVFETPRLQPQEHGYSFLPYLPGGGDLELVVYPHFAPTRGIGAVAQGPHEPVTDRVRTPLPGKPGGVVKFSTDDAKGLPNRLVTGLAATWRDDAVPSECSYGIITAGYKAASKHWYWGLAGRQGLTGLVSGFFASDLLPTEQFKDTVDLALFDEDGLCGERTIPMAEFRAGPVDIGTVLDRAPKGWIYYRAALDYTMASFFSCVFDPKRRSGAIEHSF
jgi:hypothetical protein